MIFRAHLEIHIEKVDIASRHVAAELKNSLLYVKSKQPQIVWQAAIFYPFDEVYAIDKFQWG